MTVTEITEAVAIESRQASWSDLLNPDAVRSRRRVIIACILNACQAWSGSTPVSYYTTYMFVLPLRAARASADDTVDLKIPSVFRIIPRSYSPVFCKSGSLLPASAHGTP